MKKFLLGAIVAIFALPSAWASTDAIEGAVPDRAMIAELALALNGVSVGPDAICEGPAICKQVSGCSYKCFGPAKGNYNFIDCSGTVPLALCMFSGGTSNCTARCIPNPF